MPQTITKKEQTHARIVDVASRAIRRAGYRGVGVADIMKEAGLTHGGFYAHFASRNAMLVEAMQHAGHCNMAALSHGMQRRLAKGATRFQALVETYLHEAHIGRIEDGCIVAALSSEMNREDDLVRQEARRRVAAMVALVQSTLPQSSEQRADLATAQTVTATMVGALQLARALGAKAGRDLLAQTRQALIERHGCHPEV
jgi:TetR/AcrR family transcriptional repressor of nem operon